MGAIHVTPPLTCCGAEGTHGCNTCDPPLTCCGAEGTHVASTLSQRRDTTGPGDCKRCNAPREMK